MLGGIEMSRIPGLINLRCLHCGGNIFVDYDAGRKEFKCLQCGRPLKETDPLPLVDPKGLKE